MTDELIRILDAANERGLDAELSDCGTHVLLMNLEVGCEQPPEEADIPCYRWDDFQMLFGEE